MTDKEQLIADIQQLKEDILIAEQNELAIAQNTDDSQMLKEIDIKTRLLIRFQLALSQILLKHI